MLLDADDCQLVLIDYQQRLLPALHEGALVLANAIRVARVAQLMSIPVWATEQNPRGLGPTEESLQSSVTSRLPKMTFSASEVLIPRLRPTPLRPQGNARSLPRHLQKPQSGAAPRETIVLAGCEAHICLLQTALELLDADLDVWVVTDACSSRTERNRDAAFDRLAAAGCELLTTEMALFEWLRSAEHPLFKDVQALVK